jgi:hypothetical protein
VPCIDIPVTANGLVIPPLIAIGGAPNPSNPPSADIDDAQLCDGDCCQGPEYCTTSTELELTTCMQAKEQHKNRSC